MVDVVGAVRVDAGDVRYRGRILAAPKAVARGQRLSMTLEPVEGMALGGAVEVVGLVQSVPSASGSLPNTPLHAGLEFTLQVTRMSRAVEMTAVEGDDDEPVAPRLESKVFRRAPVITSLEGVGLFEPSSEEAERLDTDDTWAVPPPVMGQVAPLPSEPSAIEREPTGVIGTLRQISLAEVVQGLELGRKTAKIEVRGEDLEGSADVWVREGSLVHCEVGDLFGEAAFYLLARVTQGTYRIRFGRDSDLKTIERPTAYVILEAMRRLDEENKYGAASADGPRAAAPVAVLEEADTEPPAAAPAAWMGDGDTLDGELDREFADSLERADTREGAGEPERLSTGVRRHIAEALERAFDAIDSEAVAMLAQGGESEMWIGATDEPVRVPAAVALPPPSNAAVVTAEGEPLVVAEEAILEVESIDQLATDTRPSRPAAALEKAQELLWQNGGPPRPEGKAAPSSSSSSLPAAGAARKRGKDDSQPNVFGTFFQEAREESGPKAAPRLSTFDDDEEDEENTGSFSSLKDALHFIGDSREGEKTRGPGSSADDLSLPPM